MARPRILIEDWLPIEAIGVESKRERGASSALPPLYFLHVWWARRPLTTSRAAILGSVLPAWSPDWPVHLQSQFPDRESYHKWFTHLCGIRGDPIAGRRLVDWAKTKGVKLSFNPYGDAPRAFTVNPAPEDLKLMADLLVYAWRTHEPELLDPFAGGGSIPFEGLRYGFTTYANDLNPVATVILKATLDYPAKYGPSLAHDIRKWGKIWTERVQENLAAFYPKEKGENIFGYLWARTVACPTTGKPVPLSPNWWLSREGELVAVQVITESTMQAPAFQIVRGEKARRVHADDGTIIRGNARSPWTGEVVSGDYIKTEAQAGRMGEILYAVAMKIPGTVEFRAPTELDLYAVQAADEALAARWIKWQMTGVAIDEFIPYGHRANERDIIVQYGIDEWREMYNARQLLSLSTYLETLLSLGPEIEQGCEPGYANALQVYLALALDKAAIYNNRHCRYDTGRGIRSIFDRHDFAFLWSHAEFDASANLLPWVVEQVADAVQEIAVLAKPPQMGLSVKSGVDTKWSVSITQGSATQLDSLPDGTVVNITVDPPYYNNVDYAELSDFFYVWLKRALGNILPNLFADSLTNKDDEAVANPARFHDGKRSMQQKKRLAEQDYERKMAAAFREMHRVLRDDGVLTVMFTHKKVEAWDTLASALIGAGFAIHASWPVHTESEHSLHQAKKNAAASTILLVCRKQEVNDQNAEPIWWDDIKDRVRRVARAKAEEYVQQGIVGVDLYISTFGPTLSVISEHWPVLTSEVNPATGEPIPLRPETALDLAREEVIRLRKEGLLAGRAITFDAATDWTIMAWDAFQAEEFPFDEARKLALALGLEMEDLLGPLKLVAKKGNYVVLQRPEQRRKKGMVDPDAAFFPHLIDAAHTAMLIYAEDGSGACDVFLQNRGLKRDGTFKAVLQALINAIPRTRVKGKFVRPEADVLDRMRLAFYGDELTAPVEEEPALPGARQGDLFEVGGEWGEGSEDDESEEE